MTGSLIERVRERLASESGPLRPSVVAAAPPRSGPSPGGCSATPKCWRIFVCCRQN
ncbi:helicase/secretion ATPase [Mycobacterium tuberculosis]|nr:helicase/secretion ATPase [Mycobacterium tuberculosis]